MKDSRKEKIQQDVFERNLETFKLLISDKRFQKSVKEWRERIGIEIGNKKQDSEEYWEELFLNDNKALDTFSENILVEFNLPKTFENAVAAHVLTGGINETIDIPYSNYNFYFKEQWLGDSYPTTKHVRYWDVGLITYNRMSKDEFSFAIEELREWQNVIFPDTDSFKVSKLKNIEEKLLIEQLCIKRTRERKVINSYYVDLLEKQLGSGKISQEVYDESVRKNIKEKPDIIEIKGGYTTENIKEELADMNIDKTTDAIKKIISRLKKYRVNGFIDKSRLDKM